MLANVWIRFLETLNPCLLLKLSLTSKYLRGLINTEPTWFRLYSHRNNSYNPNSNISYIQNFLRDRIKQKNLKNKGYVCTTKLPLLHPTDELISVIPFDNGDVSALCISKDFNSNITTLIKLTYFLVKNSNCNLSTTRSPPKIVIDLIPRSKGYFDKPVISGILTLEKANIVAKKDMMIVNEMLASWIDDKPILIIPLGSNEIIQDFDFDGNPKDLLVVCSIQRTQSSSDILIIKKLKNAIWVNYYEVAVEKDCIFRSFTMLNENNFKVTIDVSNHDTYREINIELTAFTPKLKTFLIRKTDHVGILKLPSKKLTDKNSSLIFFTAEWRPSTARVKIEKLYEVGVLDTPLPGDEIYNFWIADAVLGKGLPFCNELLCIENYLICRSEPNFYNLVEF